MENTVQELINLIVKRGIYQKKYYRDIPKYLWEDWIEIFINGRTLLYTRDDSNFLLLDSRYLVDNKPYSDEEIKTQSILNRRDLLQYLKGMGIWSEKELGVKTDHPPGILRILGYLVYDVLTSLYILPASLVSINNIVLGPVIGVLNGKIEDALKHKLCNFLITRNILPVVPEMALKYCLNAYYQEIDNTELIRELENNDNNMLSLNSNYSRIKLKTINYKKYNFTTH